MSTRPLPAGPASLEPASPEPASPDRATSNPARSSHAELMDRIYRHQRHVYDLTRRPYLLGREHLLDRLAPPPRGHVLEIACGTGRNLAGVLRRHPEVCVYGLDISAEMLATAAKRLGRRARLESGDARSFDAGALFGRQGFDGVILSYSLSMIPDWRGALSEAARHLAPGGELHVVDFGDQSCMPRWFDAGLRAWLRRVHVSPRDDLARALSAEAEAIGGTAVWAPLRRSYTQYGVLMRQA